MKVCIYILCYNEECIIEKTLKHYKTIFPYSKIVVCDDGSNDNSLIIADKYSCETLKIWDNNLKLSKYQNIRNNLWKKADSDWVIFCDMDELLCITEKDLENEEKYGTTIISTQGVSIVGNSTTYNLKDIDIYNLNVGMQDEWYSKNICFNKKYIKEINFTDGCHKCAPIGNIKFSKKIYFLYHYSLLGRNYNIHRYTILYERFKSKNIYFDHYSNCEITINKRFDYFLSRSKSIKSMYDFYDEYKLLQ